MCMVAFARNRDYSALEKVRRQADRPNWAYVVICDDCSHRCGWCYGGFNADLSHRMSIETYTGILGKLSALGMVQVTLAGGEPTEHPGFRAFVRATHVHGFLIHVASHGEHIDAEMAAFLAAHDVRQVQLNFQGRRFHDHIHGVRGSHGRQIEAAKHLMRAGVEVTTTTVVGRYNLDAVDEILGEAAALGVDRLRVWEAAGLGNPWRKTLEAQEIFSRCQEAARRLGYHHTLSYDPAFPGDVSVACPQLANLFMYITSRGIVRYCGAVPGGDDLDIIDCTAHSAPEILSAYLQFNARVQGDRPAWCAARSGMRPEAEAIRTLAAAPAAAPITLHV